MYTQEDLYWMWLCSQEGIGPVKRAQLLERCGGIRQVYEASETEYLEAGLVPQLAASLTQNKDLEPYKEKYREWTNAGIVIMNRDDPGYPEYLKNVQPSVDLLYMIGDVSLLNARGVAMVGARKCSPYGAGVARYFGQNLASVGYTIISGMASGIDACAHQGALEVRRKTIAVLGCGIDICYPKGNLRLYEKIAKYGLLVSEYPPGTPPKAGFFPMRNRIIAALSRAIVVVEAAERSGTLITVDQALEMGVEVFAVPGSIFEETSKGTNRLIKQGAVIIYDWKDLPIELGDVIREEDQNKEPGTRSFLDPDVQELWERVEWNPKNMQQLAREMKIETERFMQCVTFLEMAGCVVRHTDGSIARIKD